MVPESTVVIKIIINVLKRNIVCFFTEKRFKKIIIHRHGSERGVISKIQKLNINNACPKQEGVIMVPESTVVIIAGVPGEKP